MMKRAYVLRIAVITVLVVAAIALAIFSYGLLASYEDQSATSSFRSTASYVKDTLIHDFGEKENAVLGIAKSMAYANPNISQWPNVVIPGFYDVAIPQRDAASLTNMFYLPLVRPDKVPAFEVFMAEYFDNEPEIGPGPYFFTGKGVYAFNPQGGTYHDNGETTTYGSPNKFVTPLFQVVFGSYFKLNNLGVNTHSSPTFGVSMDNVVECAKTAVYSTTRCISITNLLPLPLQAPRPLVTDFHSAFIEPIYLNKNTSRLVGFMGGGFNWIELLTPILRTAPPGIDIVLQNAALTVTFGTNSETIYIIGFGDHHDTTYNPLRRSIRFFTNPDGSNGYSTYVVTMYPTDRFYNEYRSYTPIYAGVGTFVLLVLCIATFFLYDHYMRKSAAAHAAVLETKRRFVRFISHEIRTPLNAVHLGLEALIAELRRTIEVVGIAVNSFKLQELLSGWLELATEMMANSDSAEDVLDDLLNYDKIEMGTLHLEFSAVPIWDVVKTNASAFQHLVIQKNISMAVENKLVDEIERQSDCSTDIVVGDSARLAQVMRNLVSNALKFTPRDGSISIQVARVSDGLPHAPLVVPEDKQHLLEQPRAGSVRISVTDSGAGLSEAQLAKICSEGVQFNPNELQAGKGCGLGLFITKGIVEQHGGKLTVTSGGIGEGTTFAVELPLFVGTRSERTSESDGKIAVVVEDNSTIPPPAPGTLLQDYGDCAVGAPSALPHVPPQPHEADTEQPKRILVVDDVMSNRKMLMRILTAKGYVCDQAEDGQQAIDVYRAAVESGQPFYAITMDFEMPVMNGPTATGHLRDMGCTIPIVGVTGNVLPEDIKYFKAQGATEILGKPVNISKFQELMSMHACPQLIR